MDEIKELQATIARKLEQIDSYRDAIEDLAGDIAILETDVEDLTMMLRDAFAEASIIQLQDGEAVFFDTLLTNEALTGEQYTRITGPSFVAQIANACQVTIPDDMYLLVAWDHNTPPSPRQVWGCAGTPHNDMPMTLFYME